MLSGASISQAASELVGIAEKIGEGIVVARYAYKKMLLAKRIGEIKKINDLHARILSRIKVNDTLNVEIHLPEIFIIGSPTDEHSIQGLHFNDAILNDINNSIASNGKGELLSYDICIEAAVSKIHAFYNRRLHQRIMGKRGKFDDDTSVVLCYLIEMLNTHCSKFEGFDVDIALLTALAEFTNSFASLHGQSSDRMKSLTPVYDYLMRARNILIKHSKSLSLDELMEDLIRDTKLYSFKMIKNFARLITPRSNWMHIDTISLEEIVRGIIKPKSVRFNGKFFSKDFWTSENAVMFPDSILKDWLIRCAKDFLLATESDFISDEKGFYVESHKFKRDFTRYELHKLKHNVFDRCENFITVKASKEDKHSATDKIVHLREGKEIKERMNVLADYADLVELNLVILFFGVKFQKSIKQLGEIYAETPHHFRAVYYVWEQLSLLERKMANALENQIQVLQAENTNLELLADQQSLLTDIKNTLSFVQSKIAVCIEKIVSKHGHKNEEASPALVAHSEKYHLFLITELISVKYNIPLPIMSQEAETKEEKFMPRSLVQEIEEEKNSILTPNFHYAEQLIQPSAEEMKYELLQEEKVTIVPENQSIHVSHEIIPEEKIVALPQKTINNYENIPATLNSLIVDLQIKIDDLIKNGNHKRKEIYEKLYLSLVGLQAKNLFLVLEHRSKKADELYALGMQLCSQVIEFLNHEEPYQLSHADNFLAGIKNSIAHAQFINKHKDGHELLDFLHINTNTKKLTNKVETASENLVKTIKSVPH